jgi:basic membrane lipoprotein Med (substrate-binding protein (PBP1-ABC) superfamily)
MKIKGVLLLKDGTVKNDKQQVVSQGFWLRDTDHLLGLIAAALAKQPKKLTVSFDLEKA